MDRPQISIVLPVYNERENLEPLLSEISTVLGTVPHEVVAVDDGSTDGSRTELQRLESAYPTLRIVSLNRNCGQSAALMAGFEASRGDVIVTMDADGQNDPADVPRLLDILDRGDGCDAVVGYRIHRADSWWKRMQSRVANAARDAITGDRVQDTGCSLKAIRRPVVQTLPRFDGMHRFLPTLIRIGGGSVTEVPVAHRPRRYGVSKYGMWDRATRGLVDAMAVRWLRRRRITIARPNGADHGAP